MREVELSQNLTAQVDDDDYERVMQFRWTAMRHRGGQFYAFTNIPHPTRADRLPCGKKRRLTLMMHRFILGLEVGDKRQGDHKDGNGLNNQRCNLRIVTSGQNQMNRRSALGSSSQYLGVTWAADRGKWKVRIRHCGKEHYVGEFINEKEAAEAYDVAARSLHGEYARLNLI